MGRPTSIARCRVLLPALAGAAACLSLSAAQPVGLARSDEPFLVQAAPVRHNATILAGEAVSSNHLPLRVHLASGHELILGPGSQARFWDNRVRLDGVSLDFEARPGAALAIQIGALTLQPSDGGSGAIYGDRPGLASVWVRSGSVRASLAGQEMTLEAGAAATLSEAGGQLRAQDKRAPLEIARIQIRQLQYLGQMAAVRPGIRTRSQPLLERLAAASGGLLQAAAAGASERAAVPAVDPAQLLEAAMDVHGVLLREPWVQAGCGSPDCMRLRPVKRPHDFDGWAGGMPPPQPGCELCRPGGDVELE